jgi:hypothetical protein
MEFCATNVATLQNNDFSKNPLRQFRESRGLRIEALAHLACNIPEYFPLVVAYIIAAEAGLFPVFPENDYCRFKYHWKNICRVLVRAGFNVGDLFNQLLQWRREELDCIADEARYLIECGSAKAGPKDE